MLACEQNFAHLARKALLASSATVRWMAQDDEQDLNDRIARNLATLMARAHPPWTSRRALAKKAQVSPGTINNLLHPERRLTTNKPQGYPTVDTLQTVALAMGKEAWHLLHPNVSRALEAEEILDKVLEVRNRRDSDPGDQPDESSNLPPTIKRRRSTPLPTTVHEREMRYNVGAKRKKAGA